MRRHQRDGVPEHMVSQVDYALAQVGSDRAILTEVIARRSPLPARREAHARLASAYAAADTALRAVVDMTKAESSTTRPGSFVTWSCWRSRLSRLDAERQAHLLAQSDDLGVLPPGSVRAVDTGMLGPDIGELQYGQSKPAGTPARIGVDLAAVLGTEAPTAPHRPWRTRRGLEHREAAAA